ncbi:hypothetical protein NQZ79_g1670 [Umbelopsis isabellina]|nr:hypothetical protein NQZ79_g1670 [Umbelopsis isabellina]
MALLILSDEQVVMSPRPPSTKRIEEDMDVDQGYDVNLRRPEKFGYIHNIFTPFVRLPPDQNIHQSDDDFIPLHNKLAHVPDKALVVLREFQYNKPSEPIVFKGRVSKRTARSVSRLKKGYTMTFKFATFDYDHSAGQWYEHIVSGNRYPHADELTGRVQEVTQNGRDIEIVVAPLEGLVQNIAVAENGKRGSIDVGWGPATLQCPMCGKYKCNCNDLTTQNALLQDLLF